jgi:hypothetical protein
MNAISRSTSHLRNAYRRRASEGARAGVEQSVHSERVSDVVIDVFGLVDVASVTVVG